MKTKQKVKKDAKTKKEVNSFFPHKNKNLKDEGRIKRPA